MKGIRLNKPERKNKVFEYSPSIEYDKINLNNNDKINNISIININKSALEDQEQEDLFDKKKIEDMAYDKYIINYSKDLRIVKNNKIILKSKEQKEIKEKEENKINENDILMKENENMIQIIMYVDLILLLFLDLTLLFDQLYSHMNLLFFLPALHFLFQLLELLMVDVEP